MSQYPRNKISIIGLGYGDYQYDVLKDLNQEILVLIDKNPQKLARRKYENVKTATSIKKAHLLIEKSDIIILSLPPAEHYDIFRENKAVFKNKVILLEKPVALNTEELKKIQRISYENNIKVVIDHSLRFNPIIKKLKVILTPLHYPYLIEIFLGQGLGYLEENTYRWYHSASLGGGQVKMVFSHFYDLLLFLFPEQRIQQTFIGKEVIEPIRKDKMGIKHFINAEEFFAGTAILTKGTIVNFSNTTYEYRSPHLKIVFYYPDQQLILDTRKGISRYSKEGEVNLGKFKFSGRYSIFSESFKFLARELVNYNLSNFSSLNEAYEISKIIHQDYAR